jgi:hypothetical protein
MRVVKKAMPLTEISYIKFQEINSLRC